MLQSSDQKTGERPVGTTWSMWPPTIIYQMAGEMAKEAASRSKEDFDELGAKNIKRCDEALEKRIDQLGDRMDILLVQAHNEIKEVAANTVKEQLEPLGHTLIVDLAQNIAKACLVSGTGILGAIFAYKHMMAYFDIKHTPKTLYARWHEQKLAQYKEYHSFGAAHFLLAKLKKVGIVDTHDEQRKQAQLSGAGVLTLATACVLCSYWIH